MLTVEEVRRADQRRRFHELGRVLFADEPRWAPVLRTYEAWLFEPRHPYRQHAEVVRFLVRRSGDVVGRICAHHGAGSADGWFGALECTDDAGAMALLIDAAREWVAEQGARTLAGPATFTLGDEVGVLEAGFEHRGGTGRPWHPPWYLDHLTAAGLEPLERAFPRWRLATTDRPGPGDRSTTAPAGSTAVGGPLPPHAGRLGDRRLVLTGGTGAIAAVPDVSATLRATSLRAARRPPPTDAAIVRLEGDPTVLVPDLLGAAAAAGYAHVWSPWCPDPGRMPDTVHRVLGAAA